MSLLSIVQSELARPEFQSESVSHKNNCVASLLEPQASSMCVYSESMHPRVCPLKFRLLYGDKGTSNQQSLDHDRGNGIYTPTL